MDQLFVNRVVGSVCRVKLPPTRRAPGGVVFGDAPLEYDLNLLSRRNLRCDLRRNRDLAVRREKAGEAFQERTVIADPVQRSVGEDEIE